MTWAGKYCHMKLFIFINDAQKKGGYLSPDPPPSKFDGSGLLQLGVLDD